MVQKSYMSGYQRTTTQRK